MVLPAQLRAWVVRASRAELALTAASAVAVVGLLLASVSLRPDEVAAMAGAPGAGSGATAGAPSAGRPGDPGVAGTVPVGGSTGGESGRVEPDGSAAAPSPSAAAGAAPRAASDRGVTADAVTVGFLTQAPGGLSSTGFSTGQRSASDGPRFVQALADWANRNGGANGRKIRAVLRPTDPTSVEDQAAACRAMVDDAKVFGVVDVAALLDTASLDCLTNTTKGDTPLVHSVLWSRDWQRRSGGNEVSYQAAIDRISVTWARDLGAMGWFPKGATVGILGDKCPATQPTIEHVLAPALEAQGAGKVVIGSHDCNISAVVGEPPNIATRFRLEGVTHVVIVSNFAAAQIFMTTAKNQGYTPKYSVSDWFLNTSDATTAGYPPDQFDGAVGIASVGASLRPSGMAPYDGWQECSQIAVGAGLGPMNPDDSASGELLSLCDNFRLLLDALRAAGPNPTRATWRAAVTTLGQRTSLVFGPSRFGPGKLSGSDTVHTITWRRDCRCWRSVGGFRPAAA